MKEIADIVAEETEYKRRKNRYFSLFNEFSDYYDAQARKQFKSFIGTFHHNGKSFGGELDRSNHNRFDINLCLKIEISRCLVTSLEISDYQEANPYEPNFNFSTQSFLHWQKYTFQLRSRLKNSSFLIRKEKNRSFKLKLNEKHFFEISDNHDAEGRKQITEKIQKQFVSQRRGLTKSVVYHFSSTRKKSFDRDIGGRNEACSSGEIRVWLANW